MKAQDALPAAVRRLTEAGVPDAMRDARRLLAHAMHLAPDRMVLHLADPLTAEDIARFDAAIAARARRQPLSQIIGHREFFGRSFRISGDVLDPRPETEVLVLAALSLGFDRVLDLGTGSGCILLSLLAERAEATGIGTDLSEPALAVARSNARRFALQDRAAFHIGDWFGAVAGQGRFDLVVSNPPYLAQGELADLAPEVRDWEPHLALTPGGDGLDAYRIIAASARDHLTPEGRLLVEVGPTQGRAVAELMASVGLGDIRILPDLDGRDRVVAGQNR